jgi:surface antigen
MASRLKALTAAAVIAFAGFGAVAMTPSVASAEGVSSGWQCAQFARLFSGIQIFGNAHTWWQQAVGKYGRGQSPEVGAVLVFRPHGSMKLGHVAVVSRVVTDRVIQVTHANWSVIGGARGQVEKDVTVVDVSPSGDWSSVKVWYNPTHDLGTSVYPTYGFVYKGAAQSAVASADKAEQNSAKADMDPISRLLSAVSGNDTQQH